MICEASQRPWSEARAAVHPSRDELPEGQIFHAAGPAGDGWTVTAIRESRDSWERFRDDILMPKLSEGIPGGFTTPPQERAFEVHNLQRSMSESR
jgi:hypothetical protein